MKDKLKELIPEFDTIQNEELREKTIRVWERGMEHGGWKPKDLLRMPFTLLIPDCPVNFIEHVRGVTQVCIGTAKAFQSVYGNRIPINLDTLISGALLHDVGKLVEFSEEKGKFVKSPNGKALRHPFSGVGLCYLEDIPPEVMHIVAVHSKEGDDANRSSEAIILHHADFTNFEPLK